MPYTRVPPAEPDTILSFIPTFHSLSTERQDLCGALENKEMRDGLALRAHRPVGDRMAKSMADRGLQDGDDLSPRGCGDTEC